MKYRNGIIRSVMKLPKKVYLAAAVLLFMGGAGTAVALYPESEPKKVVVEQVASQEPQEQPEQATEPVESPPAVVETVVEEEAPVDQPKTVNELKAMATVWVNDNNKCDTFPDGGAGCPAKQGTCFDWAIEMRYGWANVDETFVNNKLAELHGAYTGMCAALNMLKSSTGHIYDATYAPLNLPADFANYPPGFRN